MSELDINIIDKISKATGIIYSDEQYKILKYRGGMSIDACAGSGKTTILTHLIAKRILSGEIKDANKLLFTTYSKSGAIEMEERLQVLFKNLGIKQNVTVKTMHSFYLSIIKQFGLRDISVINDRERTKFIRESALEAQVKADDDTIRILDSLLSYQVNNLLSDDALVNSYVYTLKGVSKSQYSSIRSTYSVKKQKRGLMDFDDMQLYLYDMLYRRQRDDVEYYIKSNWTDIYIDEAQDISKIQFAILRKIVSNHDKLVFVGDMDQCIYQWRGAEPSILLNINGYYDIARFTLSINYRCLGNIVRQASNGVAYNKKRIEKVIKPYKDGGSLKIYDTKTIDIYKQSKYAFNYIVKLINDGVNPSKIAVISRNNNHLSILNNLLFREGIYSVIAQDMKITNSEVFKDIKNLFILASNTSRSDITYKTIWKVVQYLGVKGAKFIGDFQNYTGATFKDVLKYILGISTTHLYVPDAIKDGTQYFMDHLNETAITYLKSLYNIFEDEQDLARRMQRILQFYLNSMKFMYKTKDKYRIIKGIVDYISDTLSYMDMNSVKALLRVTEQFEQSNMIIPGDKVTLTTAHSAKGREWDYVIIFADDNVSFPSFEGIDQMASNNISMNDIYSVIEEERRLHYVAMTRAKIDLTIMADINNASVFLLEAIGAFGNTDYSRHMNWIIDTSHKWLIDKDIIQYAKSSSYYNTLDMSDIRPSDVGLEYKDQDIQTEDTEKADVISLDDIQVYAV